MIVADNGGGSYEQTPTGMTQAVCTRIFDLGPQEGYQGKIQHKLVVMFELDERKKEGDFAGKRFLVSNTYTASLDERANLRRDLESWRGRPFTADELVGFDMDTVLGVNCNLNMVAVTKGDKTYVNIAAITPLMKGQQQMQRELAADYVPEWIQRKLGTVNDGADTYSNNTMDAAPEDDRIPF